MESGPEFRPYVASEQTIPEFTLKAILLGGVLRHHLRRGHGLSGAARRADGFGLDPDRGPLDRRLQEAREVHDPREQHRPDDRLGRRVDRRRRGLHGPGAASSSRTGADYFKYFDDLRPRRDRRHLGVLFMIPLRRALIVKEHGNLPYPEGTACADVLIAGEKGGNLAQAWCSRASAPRMLYKFLYGILGLWNETATWFQTGKNGKIPDATLNVRRDARVPRPRLHHRAPDRGRARLRRRAVVAGADSADLDLRARGAAASRTCTNLGLHGGVDGPRTRTPSGSTSPTSGTSAPGAVACAGVMTLDQDAARRSCRPSASR